MKKEKKEKIKQEEAVKEDNTKVKKVQKEDKKQKKLEAKQAKIDAKQKKKEEKEAKKKANAPKKAKIKERIFEELRSFLIILLIIGILVLATILFLKYAKPVTPKDPTEEPKTEEKDEIKKEAKISYETKDGNLEILNKKYLLELKDNSILKIMDLHKNVIFENKEEKIYQNEILEGIDGNLYVVKITNTKIDENVYRLYKIENNKLTEIYNLDKENTIFKNLCTKDNKLIGTIKTKNYTSSELEHISLSSIYLLNGEEVRIVDENGNDNYKIIGDKINYGYTKAPSIITNNKDYIIVKNKENKYGVFNLKDKKMIINPQYDQLSTTLAGNYIAKKGKLTGIIDKKLKKLVDIKYDFIDEYDEFYVVSKENKLAIMDSNYKFKTDFVVPYKNEENVKDFTPDSDVPQYKAFKIGEKYYIITGISKDLNSLYKAEKIYALNDKEVKSIEIDTIYYNQVFYGYDLKEHKLNIYDNSLNVKNTIDLSKYDFNKYPEISIKGNNLVVKLDTNLYFELDTGKELKCLGGYTKIMGNFEITYDDGITISKDSKEIVNLKDDENLDFILVDEGLIYKTKNKYTLLIGK